MIESHRAIGALVGSAVGDALGAPFEFGDPGDFSMIFPEPLLGPNTEMIGGGSFGWAPGEFTDDTQMAVLLGESLCDHHGFNGADVFERFRVWAVTAGDVGMQTRSVLNDGDWQHSATRHFERTGHSAGNGSLMRATTSALHAAVTDDSVAALQLARAQSALTHGDPAAGWGAALYHGLIHVAVRGESPLATLPTLLNRLPVDHADRYRKMLISDVPTRDEPHNGTVWTCLAQAVRVLRNSTGFEDAMRQVCDVGGDVDTVACVAGGLAGATYGIQSIPARWTKAVHGTVAGKTYRNHDLQNLALRLIGRATSPMSHEIEMRGPIEITDGVFAANTRGALDTPPDWAVLSLCRIGEVFETRKHHREFFLIDRDNANPGLEIVVQDAIAEIAAFRAAEIPVVVHCHAGESRTGFVLRAWLMHSENIGVSQATTRVAALWPHMKHHTQDFERALRDLDRRAS